MKVAIKALVFGLFTSLAAQAQLTVSPYVSSGVASHLSYVGVNTEVGLLFEYKRLELGVHYRQCSMNSGQAGHVSIVAAAPTLSFAVINGERHSFKIGCGLGYGNYRRYLNNYGVLYESPETQERPQYTQSFEKSYNSIMIDYVRLKYEYKIDRFKIGALALLNDDDGDPSIAAGLVFGVTLNKKE